MAIISVHVPPLQRNVLHSLHCHGCVLSDTFLQPSRGRPHGDRSEYNDSSSRIRKRVAPKAFASLTAKSGRLHCGRRLSGAGTALERRNSAGKGIQKRPDGSCRQAAMVLSQNPHLETGPRFLGGLRSPPLQAGRMPSIGLDSQSNWTRLEKSAYCSRLSGTPASKLHPQDEVCSVSFEAYPNVSWGLRKQQQLSARFVLERFHSLAASQVEATTNHS